jgi:hypothetical protein
VPRDVGTAVRGAAGGTAALGNCDWLIVMLPSALFFDDHALPYHHSFGLTVIGLLSNGRAGGSTDTCAELLFDWLGERKDLGVSENVR